MTYIVLNCRDEEHRDKAIKRLEASGRKFWRRFNIAEELQIYAMYDGELSFDGVSTTQSTYDVHHKIKSFIKAMDAAHPIN